MIQLFILPIDSLLQKCSAFKNNHLFRTYRESREIEMMLKRYLNWNSKIIINFVKLFPTFNISVILTNRSIVFSEICQTCHLLYNFKVSLNFSEIRIKSINFLLLTGISFWVLHNISKILTTSPPNDWIISLSIKKSQILKEMNKKFIQNSWLRSTIYLPIIEVIWFWYFLKVRTTGTNGYESYKLRICGSQY